MTESPNHHTPRGFANLVLKTLTLKVFDIFLSSVPRIFTTIALNIPSLKYICSHSLLSYGEGCTIFLPPNLEEMSQ